MKLNQTTIGEIYGNLTPIEIKRIDVYIRNNGSAKTHALHKCFADIAHSNMLHEKDYGDLKKKLFKTTPIHDSSFTTMVNLLTNHIKDFLILSKIQEKNIYTETLWGEILIERRLKRNLLLKISNFKFDLYKDSYALMKKFFHDRESFFYEYISLTKKNYKKMIIALLEHNYSFNNYVDFYLMEQGNSYLSLSKQINHDVQGELEFYVNQVNKLIDSKNSLVKVQALMLSLTIDNNEDNYYNLARTFKEKFSHFSLEINMRLYPALINYGTKKIRKGRDEFNEENYRIFSIVDKGKNLFKQGFFSVMRILAYILLELRYGTIEKAEQLLEESLKVLAADQRDSFQNLIESCVAFAQEDYKLSLRKISTINPADSIYYYPQYKIMLIKCYIMLADIDRMQAEQENFYKYLNNCKNIQEDASRRHKLYIKYSQYLTEARYEYLTHYMKKRIENALLHTSPYFTEKHWVRERFCYLQQKFDEPKA